VAHGAAGRTPLERDQKAFRALVVAGIVAFVNLPLAKLDQFFVPSFSLLFALFFPLYGFLAFSFSSPFAFFFPTEGFLVFSLSIPFPLSFALFCALAGLFLALKVLPLTFG
jgi:hypothetical protein